MKSRKKSFYTTEPFYRENLGYYIHWRAENLGRLKRGKTGDITKYFVIQKNKWKQEAGKALKKQYANLLYNQAIDLSDPESAAFASRLVGKGRPSDSLITALDEYIKTDLEKRINEETIKAALITGNEFTATFKKEDLSHTLASNLTKAGNTLNKLLEAVAQVINTLKVKENYQNFCLGLTAAEISGVTSISQLGELFGSKVKEIEKLSKNQKFYINKKQIDVLTTSLNTVTHWLKSDIVGGKRKNGDTFTYQNLKSLFDTEISPVGIGEVFGFYIKRQAQDILGEIIIDSIKYIGKDDYPIIYSDPNGNYPKNNPMADTNMDEEKQGKADIKFNHFQITLKKQKGIKKDTVLQVSIGVSNKLYLKNTLIKTIDDEKQLKKQLTGSIKVSKSVSLGAAIKSTFHKERLIYLAYNTFAWQDESPEANAAVESLQDIIFTRNLIHAMSARSGDDFAGYILMNGKLHSVWDIIQYALLNDIGALTESQQTSGSKGIKYAWTDKKGGIEAAKGEIVQYVRQRNKISMDERIIGANKGINKTKLYVYLNPNLL